MTSPSVRTFFWQPRPIAIVSLSAMKVGSPWSSAGLRNKKIAVNSIAPGFTDTPMTRTMPPEQYAAAVALEPGKAPASPEDIADAIAFFASPGLRFVTGQTLFVDGGKSLGGLGI